MNFACTNNTIEFEALLLGLEKAHNLGYHNLQVFGDSNLIVNMIKRIYTPSNKLMRHYTTLASKKISDFATFSIAHINRSMNTIVDGLAMFSTRLDRYDMAIITLYRPHFLDNDESWNIFEDYDTILGFLKDEVQEPSRVINTELNRYPKGLAHLEGTFSPSDASKIRTSENKFSKKIDQVEQVNIGTETGPKILNLSKSCSPHEKEKFLEFFYGFSDVFAQSYKDLKGFDPVILIHAIPLRK